MVAHNGVNESSCEIDRIRICKAADKRENNLSRVPALEASIGAYTDYKAGTVVNPAVGTSFDSVEEA